VIGFKRTQLTPY
jgi:hypothetical protein